MTLNLFLKSNFLRAGRRVVFFKVSTLTLMFEENIRTEAVQKEI